MEQVNVVIDKDGNVSVGVSCVKGKSCQDVSKAIEQALGKVTSDKPTAEMYEKGKVNATA